MGNPTQKKQPFNWAGKTVLIVGDKDRTDECSYTLRKAGATVIYPTQLTAGGITGQAATNVAQEIANLPAAPDIAMIWDPKMYRAGIGSVHKVAEALHHRGIRTLVVDAAIRDLASVNTLALNQVGVTVAHMEDALYPAIVQKLEDMLRSRGQQRGASIG